MRRTVPISDYTTKYEPIIKFTTAILLQIFPVRTRATTRFRYYWTWV